MGRGGEESKVKREQRRGEEGGGLETHGTRTSARERAFRVSVGHRTARGGCVSGGACRPRCGCRDFPGTSAGTPPSVVVSLRPRFSTGDPAHLSPGGRILPDKFLEDEWGKAARGWRVQHSVFRLSFKPPVFDIISLVPHVRSPPKSDSPGKSLIFC